MDTTKIFIFFLIFIFISPSMSMSQPGWIRHVVKQSKDLPENPDADAIVLHNVVTVEITSKLKAIRTSQAAYKILTNNGKKFGTLSVPISPLFIIKSLKGWRFKKDGDSQSLSRENIVTISSRESAGYYDDSHVMIATFPGVDPGDIVAFQWRAEEKGWTCLNQTFVFQVQQPVRYTQFSVEIPQNWQLVKSEWHTDKIRSEQQKNRYIWTGYDLPYQPEEPLAPPWYYLSRRITLTCFDPDKKEINLFANWNSIANWCADIYNRSSMPTDEILSETNKITLNAKTFEDKVALIARFIQEEIRYVAVEIGKGRWQPRPASATLFNRYGDCKDKTTLMMAMLKAVNIGAVPVLANISLSVDPRLPTPFQFDHCIIGIQIEQDTLSPLMKRAKIGRWLIFDPTDFHTPIGELPYQLQGRRVLLGADIDTVLIRLPFPEPQDYRRVYRGKSLLNNDGSFIAEITITDFGGWAAKTRYEHRTKSKKKQEEHWCSILSQTVPGVELFNYQTKDDRDSVSILFSIKGLHYLQKSGNFSLLRVDLFHCDEAPKLTSNERIHPIWFGPPMEIETNITWQLPNGWIAEIDSTAIQCSCDGAAIYSKMGLSNNILKLQSIQQQTGRLMMPEDYKTARQLSQKLSHIKGLTILIKCK